MTLKEQEAVMPTRGYILDTKCCGECAELVEYTYVLQNDKRDNWRFAHFNFCPWCGKKVKWDE